MTSALHTTESPALRQQPGPDNDLGGIAVETTVMQDSGRGQAGYLDFLRRKTQHDSAFGFEPVWTPGFLFPFQTAMVAWALQLGRAALFEDCGMGKTVQELVWGTNVVRYTNRPVLHLTPLAVAGQTIREAERFGIEAHRSMDGKVHPGINITNYQQLHRYDPADFGGFVADESAILKSFDGTTKAQVTEFARTLRFRLLGTATAAPNDYVELGTSSEALGYLGYMDMLGRFFKNDQHTTQARAAFSADGDRAAKWRFKGHAEEQFWRWVCSWARALRRPSDLGFDDGNFNLPQLVEREHIVGARTLRPGMLFAVAARSLAEQREERRRTITERCEKAASLVADTGKPVVMWCHLNPEGDLLEKIVPGAIQVSGRDSDDEKEEKFEAFTAGQIRVLITKPVIGAWGLNWQHCAHQTMFASHSFEQYYQGVRRSWRFGQRSDVVIDHVVSDGEAGVLSNLRRKASQADVMFERLIEHMRDGLSVARVSSFVQPEAVPSWL